MIDKSDNDVNSKSRFFTMNNVDFNKNPSPEYYKEFLLHIYKCKVPFKLRFRKTMPKHYIGLYVIKPHRIILYPKKTDAQRMLEVAIHEYAHHVHHTELSKGDPKLDRSHGHNFTRIYTALRARAFELGLLSDVYDKSDELIYDILNG